MLFNRPTLIFIAAAIVLLPVIQRPVVASEILILGIAAIAVNLLLGYTGMLSFGQAMFFGIGAYLAGLAGALSTPIMGLTPSMGLDILPISFVIVVIAGLGSILGAIGAGILIGLTQSLTSIWWPEAANVAIYLMMGLVIILRPQGLFGVR